MLIRDYVPIALSSLSPSTRKGWTTYSELVVAKWGDRELDDVRPTDISGVARQVRQSAKRRANSTGGVGAAEGFITCCRAIWRRAVDDGLATSNPAMSVKKPPRRPPQARRALTVEELRQVQQVLANGHDPQLALTVFRTYLETGARRDELLNVRVLDLTRTQRGATLTLEIGTKANSIRHQPITHELADHLERLARARIGEDLTRHLSAQLLRNQRGEPITHRWLETKAARIRKEVPELGTRAEVWFTWHLLRYTASQMVERVGGTSVAATFLGHSIQGTSAAAITLHYTRASTDELRRVHSIIWGPTP